MDNIDVMLKNAFSNKYFSTSVSVVLALYAGALAPALPNKLIEIADTLLGKIIFVFLIGYLSTKNIQLSIMVAVAFAVTLTVVNKNRINEAYSNYNMVKNINSVYNNEINSNTFDCEESILEKINDNNDKLLIFRHYQEQFECKYFNSIKNDIKNFIIKNGSNNIQSTLNTFGNIKFNENVTNLLNEIILNFFILINQYSKAL